ncbi:energy transducer TonB [Candidatus Omnitrophota bacterium]
MQQESTFKTTLFISIVLHAAILASLPFFKSAPSRKELTTLEVTYRHIADKLSNQNRYGISKDLLSVKQKEPPRPTLPKDQPKIETIKRIDLSKLFKPKESISVPKPQTLKKAPKVKKISLRNLPVEASKDPAYLTYRDIIRRKIQDKVYYYSNQYFYFENPREGSVFVSFTVTSDGALKDFSILENKSSNDMILRKIARLAIEDSSPFQKFPKELKYNERNFNLEISFEIE